MRHDTVPVKAWGVSHLRANWNRGNQGLGIRVSQAFHGQRAVVGIGRRRSRRLLPARPVAREGLGPHGVMAAAGMAGVVRWVVVMGSTTAVVALALVQPLHGLTCAALH